MQNKNTFHQRLKWIESKVITQFQIKKKMNKNNFGNYQSLSAELYEIDKPKVANDELLFYIEYALQANGLILEPMCGTGRFLMPFMEGGFLIEGFDASQSMLDILMKKSRQKNLKPKIWKGALQDLNVKIRYDLVLIPDSSFNLLLNEETIKLCLNNIYKHLNKEGKFVFELTTLNYMKKVEANKRKSFSTEVGDGNVIFQNIFIMPFEGPIVTTKSYCELHNKKDRVEKIEVEELSFFFHDPVEVSRWLAEAGFREIKRLKAFDHAEQAEEEDEVIVIECSK